MDTLTSMKVFRQVVESGSFVGAAERLDLSTAMVSRHVVNIETRLHTRLLNRNSRKLSLTEPGRLYYERARSILDEIETAESELGSLGGTVRGRLRVTCPSWFAGQILADALVEFHRRYPEIVVDVSFEDRLVNLVEEGVDVGLRVIRDLRTLPQELIARPVRQLTGWVAASPEYLRLHGAPKTPEDLASHRCIAINQQQAWVLKTPDGIVEVPARVVARYRSMAGVANAAAAGLGMATLPDVILDDPLFREKLVPVLPDFAAPQATMYVVYASRKFVPLKLRAFIDFALEWDSRIGETKLPRT